MKNSEAPAPWFTVERGITESTLWEQDLAARVLFVTLLAIASEPGRRGCIDMTKRALAARASLTLEELDRGLEILMAPDPQSRSREEEGRRLVLLDAERPWGWRLVTWEKRAELHKRAAATARKRRQRANEEDEEVPPLQPDGHDVSRDVTPGHGSSPRKERKEKRKETETKREEGVGEPPPPPPPPASPAPARRPSPSDLLATWNSNRGPLPAAEELNAERARKATARLREVPDLARWAAGIQKAATTPFCTGENDRGWRATFDFLIKPGTLAKLLEGSYDARKAQPVRRVGAVPPGFRAEDEPPGSCKLDGMPVEEVP